MKVSELLRVRKQQWRELERLCDARLRIDGNAET